MAIAIYYNLWQDPLLNPRFCMILWRNSEAKEFFKLVDSSGKGDSFVDIPNDN